MSKEQQLRLHGHGGNDEVSDRPDTRHFHRGDEESDEENADINEIDEATIKKSRVQDTSATVSSDIINMIETYDRPASANTEGGYATQGFYVSGLENKPGKRIPKAGYLRAQDTSAIVSSDIIHMNGIPVTVNKEAGYAKKGCYVSYLETKTGMRIPKIECFSKRGTGRVSAECSLFVAEADAKGPNSSYSLAVGLDEVEVMARAELASASAKAGPVGLKVGLGFDTGLSASADRMEAKFLGTGITIGSKTSVSVLGSEASCSVM